MTTSTLDPVLVQALELLHSADAGSEERLSSLLLQSVERMRQITGSEDAGASSLAAAGGGPGENGSRAPVPLPPTARSVSPASATPLSATTASASSVAHASNTPLGIPHASLKKPSASMGKNSTISKQSPLDQAREGREERGLTPKDMSSTASKDSGQHLPSRSARVGARVEKGTGNSKQDMDGIGQRRSSM